MKDYKLEWNDRVDIFNEMPEVFKREQIKEIFESRNYPLRKFDSMMRNRFWKQLIMPLGGGIYKKLPVSAKNSFILRKFK